MMAACNSVVIGEREKILPFKALGMWLEYAASGEELETALERTARNTAVSLIIVNEDIAAAHPEVISSFRQRLHVPIIALPSHLGSTGASIIEASKIVKRAIGVDILEGGRD